jgi:LysM repeat protein
MLYKSLLAFLILGFSYSSQLKQQCTMTYTIEHGDTLLKIAEKFKTTADILIKMNSIEDPELIFQGEKIKVPCPEPYIR